MSYFTLALCDISHSTFWFHKITLKLSPSKYSSKITCCGSYGHSNISDLTSSSSNQNISPSSGGQHFVTISITRVWKN